MELILDIQNTLDKVQIPTESQMHAWISQTIADGQSFSTQADL